MCSAFLARHYSNRHYNTGFTLRLVAWTGAASAGFAAGWYALCVHFAPVRDAAAWRVFASGLILLIAAIAVIALRGFAHGPQFRHVDACFGSHPPHRGGTMSVFVCIVALLAVIFSLLTNRDVFSPGKFYLISFIMFYAGALASPDDHELWLLVLLVLMVGIATVCLETHSPPPRAFRGAREPGPGPRRERSVALWVWLATLPAIAAQIYIVQLFGGIEGYISMFGNRVIEFRGLGWAKTLMSTVVALNLIYFGVGLTRRRSKIWWSAFAVHVLVVLGIGALAGIERARF